MVCTNLDSPARAAGSSIVLRARILDAAERPIRAADVVAIECAIREVDSQFPVAKMDVHPCEVILPGLVSDRLWKIDDVGYNFRHDLAGIADLATAGVPDFSDRVEVRYTFVLIDCTRATVSFYLKLL
jgi:hypothetical protein